MVHFDYELEPDTDASLAGRIGDWTIEQFMINLEALIVISSNGNEWKFLIPVMNFVDAAVTAASQLSISRTQVVFKDWDSSFKIYFTLDGEYVLIESDDLHRFVILLTEFKNAVFEFSDRVRIDLEQRYPKLAESRHFQQFFSLE